MELAVSFRRPGLLPVKIGTTGADILLPAKERTKRLTAPFPARFLALLEPDPRAMKRLLNAYALHRDLGILAGSDVLQSLSNFRPS